MGMLNTAGKVRRRFFRDIPVYAVSLSIILFLHATAMAQLIGDPVDVSQDFAKLEQVFFIGNKVTGYDPAKGSGALEWARYLRQPGLSFNKLDLGFSPAKSSDFPGAGYDENPSLPFSISFLTPRTLRLRFTTRSQPLTDAPSLMLVSNLPRDSSWKVEPSETAITYTSAYGTVRLVRDPWQIELLDKSGRLLTRTQNLREIRSFAQPVPFSFVRRARDLGHSMAASFRPRPTKRSLVAASRSRGSTSVGRRSCSTSATRWAPRASECTSRFRSS